MRKSAGSFGLEEEDYSAKESHDDFTCDTCGESFHKPLLATVLSSDHTQTYYACPRCMVKVMDTRRQASEETGKTITVSGALERKPRIQEDSTRCEHYMGYLKKRPKDMQIPDACLTCSKMIECLTY